MRNCCYGSHHSICEGVPALQVVLQERSFLGEVVLCRGSGAARVKRAAPSTYGLPVSTTSIAPASLSSPACIPVPPRRGGTGDLCG